MATQLSVAADLEFSFEVPGSPSVTGALTGSGGELELQVSHPFLFAGRADSGAIRGLAKELADRGVSISVITPSGPLVTLGTARTSWLQRRVTGSRHIRIERGAALWSLIRGQSRAPSGGALPTAELAPPSTLFPVAPTMVRRPPRPVTTTHDPHRGGNPRLIMPLGPYPRLDDRLTVFPLRDDVTTIGGGIDCDIRLPGLEPLHAEIRHDDQDEFVLVRIGSGASPRVHGAPVETAILRTGSRVDLGPWQLSYLREEYADHGRPYGGRIGGELGHQRPQPTREWQRRQVGDDR
ncbi:MAG: FHA domain-containing protein [Nocardioidaceae bacterium]